MNMAARRYQFVHDSRESMDAFSKAPNDVAIIAERNGFVPLPFFEGFWGRFISRLHRPRIAALFLRYRMARILPKGSICLFQYPSYVLVDRAFADLFNSLSKRDVKIIAIIHDIGELRAVDELQRRDLLPSTKRLFLTFDAIVVHNSSMRELLAASGIPNDRMIELCLFDYLMTNYQINSKISYGRDVVIAGNLDVVKAGYLREIHAIRNLKWVLYGANVNLSIVNCNSIIYEGAYPAELLPHKIRGSFGLVWDGPSASSCIGAKGSYLRYNNPHKLSLYLSTGLPVIVWSQSAVANFVNENGVGICIDSLFELASRLDDVNENMYERYRDNALRVAVDLIAGKYTSRALMQAVNVCMLPRVFK